VSLQQPPALEITMRTLFVIAIVLATTSPVLADSIRDNYQHSTAVAISLTAPTRANSRDTSEGTLKVSSRGNEVFFKWSDDGYVCKLTGKLSGSTIRFYAGQSCTIDDEDTDSSFKLSLVAGSGTVDDDGELDLQMSWKIKGSMQGVAVAGAANQRTTAVPF
jgi:hypothetical protein